MSRASGSAYLLLPNPTINLVRDFDVFTRDAEILLLSKRHSQQVEFRTFGADVECKETSVIVTL